MDPPSPAPQSINDINQTSIDAWTANAAYWDSYSGRSGNDFYQVLELPAVERLVDL